MSIRNVIIIGGSAGSLNPLVEMLEVCPADFPHPLVVVIHRGKNKRNLMGQIIQNHTKIPVKEVEHFERLTNGHIYIAPADYHLLIAENGEMELDFSEKVYYSRPSIDVSFQSFAQVFGVKLIGVVLSGANKDCSAGATEIIKKGGTIMVQHPEQAEVSMMPQETLNQNPEIEHILFSDQIMKKILEKTYK